MITVKIEKIGISNKLHEHLPKLILKTDFILSKKYLRNAFKFLKTSDLEKVVIKQEVIAK